MKIISWNINGLRAVEKKGFLGWMKNENPDILGLQEIKSNIDDLNDNLINPPGYKSFFNSAEKKGYSGTMIYSKLIPDLIYKGIGNEKYDREGRVIGVVFKDFVYLNIYFPNGKMNRERLQYKMDFYDACLDFFDKLVMEGKKLLIGGDFNTAHKEIDLARPNENRYVSGFLDEERSWMDKLISHGYFDCFRKFDQNGQKYTWWSVRTAARKRNVGWRIDYFFASKNLENNVSSCTHLENVSGSDHCPVAIEIVL